MRNWYELWCLAREKQEAAVRGARGALLRTARQDRGGRRPATLLLAPGEVLSIRAGRGGLAVSCVTGRLWVTTDRSRGDTLLVPGRSAEYGIREVVVIEALRTAAVRLHAGEPVRVSMGVAMRPALA